MREDLVGDGDAESPENQGEVIRTGVEDETFTDIEYSSHDVPQRTPSRHTSQYDARQPLIVAEIFLLLHPDDQ